LTDYALQRWGVAGDAPAWVDRLHEIAAAGIERVWLGFGPGDLAAQADKLRIFGERVAPHLAAMGSRR
jgi:hypothetical protein